MTMARSGKTAVRRGASLVPQDAREDSICGEAMSYRAVQF